MKNHKPFRNYIKQLRKSQQEKIDYDIFHCAWCPIKSGSLYPNIQNVKWVIWKLEKNG